MTLLDSNNIESRYTIHGRVKVSLPDNDIIYYEAIGPFNEEIIQAIGYLEKDILEKFISDDKKWTVLIEFKENCLATKETLLQHAEYIKNCKESGIIQEATALVVNKDVIGFQMAAILYKPSYEAANVPFRIFDNLIEAKSWLAEKLLV